MKDKRLGFVALDNRELRSKIKTTLIVQSKLYGPFGWDVGTKKKALDHVKEYDNVTPAECSVYEVILRKVEK